MVGDCHLPFLGIRGCVFVCLFRSGSGSGSGSLSQEYSPRTPTAPASHQHISHFFFMIGTHQGSRALAYLSCVSLFELLSAILILYVSEIVPNESWCMHLTIGTRLSSERL